MAKQADSWVNIPNFLTASRVPLAALVWQSRRSSEQVAGLALVAGATDILDGWAARRRGLENPAGIWLDPLCDKIFVMSLLATVASRRKSPAHVPALIATREILQAWAAVILAARAIRAGEKPVRAADLKAAPIGKIATMAQFAATGAMLARPRLAAPLAAVAALSGAGAALFYFRRLIAVAPTRARRQTVWQGMTSATAASAARKHHPRGGTLARAHARARRASQSARSLGLFIRKAATGGGARLSSENPFFSRVGHRCIRGVRLSE